MVIEPGTYVRVIPPSGAHKSFRVQTKVPGGGWKTFKSEGLADINRAYKLERITYQQALDRVEHLQKKLYKQRDKGTPIAVMAEGNANILNAYLADRYTRARRDRMVPTSYRAHVNYLKQALVFLSDTPIETDVEVLQERVDDALRDNKRKHKRMCASLNSILNWMGKSKRLIPYREEIWDITYISEEELGRVLSCIKNERQKIATARAFWTGLRLGELCALNEQAVIPEHIRVRGQIDANLDFRPTKTRKERIVFIEEKARLWLDRWLSLDEIDRKRFRLSRASE